MTVEDFKALTGEVIGTSDWLMVDQDRIDKFADATEDHQFIHVNEAAAKMTPFGGTIAHGFLTLSLLSRLYELASPPRPDGIKFAINYGMNKMRFVTPVKSGQRVRGVFKLLSFEEKRPGQWQMTLEATVEIEGGEKPALLAEWLSQVFV